MKLEPDIVERASRIRLLLMDCDGVLTDGRIWLTGDGGEQKTFHVRDGQGIVLLHREGVKTGIISGRESEATERRAQELGVTHLRQNVTDKIAAFEEILAKAGVTADECAYIGDDIADIPLMRKVGLAAVVNDAAEEAKNAAHYVCNKSGGTGAVREVCDLILSAVK